MKNARGNSIKIIDNYNEITPSSNQKIRKQWQRQQHNTEDVQPNQAHVSNQRNSIKKMQKVDVKIFNDNTYVQKRTLPTIENVDYIQNQNDPNFDFVNIKQPEK